MLKKLTLTLSLVICAVLIYDASNNHVLSDSNGKAGYANDPLGGNNTCTNGGCHDSHPDFTAPAGTIVMKDAANNIVTSYTGGQSYTITINAMNHGNTAGFDAIVENASGVKEGNFTSGTGCQNKSGYMTHTFSGTIGTSKSWSFGWTAPVAGTGTVTIYAVVNRANGNGSESGDSIFNTTQVLTENTGSAVEAIGTTKIISVYPNPTSQVCYLNCSNAAANGLVVKCYALNGTVVLNQVLTSNVIDLNGLAKGIYVLNLQAKDGAITSQKLVVE